MVLLRAEAEPASLSGPGLMGLQPRPGEDGLRVRARDALAFSLRAHSIAVRYALSTADTVCIVFDRPLVDLATQRTAHQPPRPYVENHREQDA